MKNSNFAKLFLTLGVSAASLGLISMPTISAAYGTVPQPTVVASAAVPRPVVENLKLGSVAVYDFGTVKIHAYQSKDALGDETYVFENDKHLVLLESTAFNANNQEWADYIKSLKKPVAGALMAYHPNGAAAYGTRIYATERALKNWQKDGGIYDLTENFKNAFGKEAVAGILPTKAKILQDGQSITLGGILFHILPAGDAAYSVEIPQIHVMYRHMMGSDTHNILTGEAHLDAEISAMKDYQEKGYRLILTGHHVPEGQEGVAEKLAYLQTMKGLIAENKTKADFIAAVKKTFPDYQGDTYLMMTADFLYPK